jgi:hypothetical protein
MRSAGSSSLQPDSNFARDTANLWVNKEHNTEQQPSSLKPNPRFVHFAGLRTIHKQLKWHRIGIQPHPWSPSKTSLHPGHLWYIDKILAISRAGNGSTDQNMSTSTEVLSEGKNWAFLSQSSMVWPDDNPSM